MRIILTARKCVLLLRHAQDSEKDMKEEKQLRTIAYYGTYPK